MDGAGGSTGRTEEAEEGADVGRRSSTGIFHRRSLPHSAVFLSWLVGLSPSKTRSLDCELKQTTILLKYLLDS